MAPMISPSDPHDVDDDPRMLTVFFIESEPDADVPVEELAWWLDCQEKAETRAALAAAGLL